MPFIPVNNTLQAKLIMQSNNQDVINDLYFVFAAAPLAADRALLATAMHTFWTNHYKLHTPDSVQLREIDIVDLSSSSAPTTQLIINPVEAGSLVGAICPLNTSLCISLRTALRGKNYRGRVYTPPQRQADEATAGTWNTSLVSNLLTDFAWLLTAANTASGIWSVVSRFLNNSPRGSGVTTPITAVTADVNIDSQRRRLIGRGRA